MAKLTIRSSAMLAALAAIALPACGKHGQPTTTAERAEIAHGEMKAGDSLTAIVDSVDAENNTVYLHDDEGHQFAVEANPGAVRRLQPQDRINVVYQEAVQFALQTKEDEPTQKTKVEDLTRLQGNNGIQFGRKISTTVQILAVGHEGSAVEFRAPEGQVRTVAIDDKDSQDKIKHLRPGDKVAVTYVEKLALALDESGSQTEQDEQSRATRHSEAQSMTTNEPR